MIGKTLKQLDLRGRFQVNVVAIKTRRPGRRYADSAIPDPDRVLKKSDHLVVVGGQSDIQRMLDALK